MYFSKNWIVLLVSLVAAHATETAKEPRFLEDNALRTIMEFTLQSKPPPDKEQQPLLINPVFLPEKESGYQQNKPVFPAYPEFPKQPGTVHINKPPNFSLYPFYNGGYSGYPVGPQSVFPVKPTPTPENYEFKPIFSYIPYPLKEKPMLLRPDRYPAPYYFNGYPFYPQVMTPQNQGSPFLVPQTLPGSAMQSLPTPLQSLPSPLQSLPSPLQTLPSPLQSLPSPLQSLTPQYFAHYTNHPDTSQRLAVGSPSFIIINPASYPTYHYHDSNNRTTPRNTAGSAGETYSFDEPTIPYDKIDDLDSQRSIEHVGDIDASAGASTAQEMEPMFITAPESGSASIAVDDDHLLVERILAQARASGNGAITTSDPLLDLLLQRNQLNRRVQERVAAIYFRNYNSNKK